MNFETLKKEYEKGNNANMVMVKLKLAVQKGLISKEQYKEITGKEY